MKHVAFVFALMVALTWGSASARTLNIASDVSKSNPLLAHEKYAKRAAQYVQAAVLELKGGDTIIIGSLGDPSDPDNAISATVPLGRRFRAADAAPQIKQYLVRLLQEAEDGQSSTHLIRWLETGSNYGCEDGSTIILLTDGLEASSRTDPRKLVNGEVDLPDPKIDLTGCTLVFFGLGWGMQDAHRERLHDQWASWSKKAGATFVAVER